MKRHALRTCLFQMGDYFFFGGEAGFCPFCSGAGAFLSIGRYADFGASLVGLLFVVMFIFSPMLGNFQ